MLSNGKMPNSFQQREMSSLAADPDLNLAKAQKIWYKCVIQYNHMYGVHEQILGRKAVIDATQS